MINYDKLLQISINICKDKEIAQELLHEAYYRMSFKEDVREPEYYLITIIKNLYIDLQKNKGKFQEITNKNEPVQSYSSILSFDDDNHTNLRRLKIVKSLSYLTWVEKQILILSYDYSFRDIEKKYNVNYQKAYSIWQKAIKKIQERNIKDLEILLKL